MNYCACSPTVTKNSLDSCIQKYDSLSSDVTALKSEVADLKNENLSARIQSLEVKLSSSNAVGSHTSMVGDVELAFAEFEERRRRAGNLIIFEVPESGSADPKVASLMTLHS